MKSFLMEFALLNNLSLSQNFSRLYNTMEDFDVICINCDEYLPSRLEYDSQEEYDKELSDRLNKYKKYDRQALLIRLKGEGYGVYKIKEFYKYTSKPLKLADCSYFVVNRKDDDNFFDKVLNLAIKCK